MILFLRMNFLVPGFLSSISIEQVLHNSVVVKWESPVESNGIILSN